MAFLLFNSFKQTTLASVVAYTNSNKTLHLVSMVKLESAINNLCLRQTNAKVGCINLHDHRVVDTRRKQSVLLRILLQRSRQAEMPLSEKRSEIPLTHKTATVFRFLLEILYPRAFLIIIMQLERQYISNA